MGAPSVIFDEDLTVEVHSSVFTRRVHKKIKPIRDQSTLSSWKVSAFGCCSA
jgi:hypothetical protein